MYELRRLTMHPPLTHCFFFSSPSPVFTVTNATRFCSMLARLESHLEPLLEWALPQLVACGCLTPQEERQCDRSDNIRLTFLSCLEHRTTDELNKLVEMLHKWRYYGLLKHLHIVNQTIYRYRSESRARSWNLPVPVLHYTKRQGIWCHLEKALKKMSLSESHWILLSGIAACGKTSAAINAAYTALEDQELGFDHVVWLKVCDTDEETVIRMALAALSYGLDGSIANSFHDSKTLYNQMEIAAFRRQRKDKILLVLDGVWEESLPTKFTAFSYVIVTSRNSEILRPTNVPYSSIVVPEALTREESLTVSS